MHEHARFERADRPSARLAELLPGLLFSPQPRLYAIVAESPTGLIGYATASLELSSWRAAEYLHMDCLYLREAARGAGTGSMLLAGIVGVAQALGAPEVQWQTPSWNAAAIRFYERAKATSQVKHRYSLPVGDAITVRSRE